MGIDAVKRAQRHHRDERQHHRAAVAIAHTRGAIDQIRGIGLENQQQRVIHLLAQRYARNAKEIRAGRQHGESDIGKNDHALPGSIFLLKRSEHDEIGRRGHQVEEELRHAVQRNSPGQLCRKQLRAAHHPEHEHQEEYNHIINKRTLPFAAHCTNRQNRRQKQRHRQRNHIRQIAEKAIHRLLSHRRDIRPLGRG